MWQLRLPLPGRRASAPVRVTVRDRTRLGALKGLEVEPVSADVLDRGRWEGTGGCDWCSIRRGWWFPPPARGLEGQRGRAADRRRVGGPGWGSTRRVTSSVGALDPRGPSRGRGRAYPERGTGMLYPDAKHEGRRQPSPQPARWVRRRRRRTPAYVLGAPSTGRCPGDLDPHSRQLPAGRLPAIVDSYTKSSTSRTWRRGICWRPSGDPASATSSEARTCAGREVVERVSQLPGVHHPLLVIPPSCAGCANALRRLGLPSECSRDPPDGARVALLVRQGPARARIRPKRPPTRSNDRGLVPGADRRRPAPGRAHALVRPDERLRSERRAVRPAAPAQGRRPADGPPGGDLCFDPR